jgi:hypothetical protein
MNWFFRRYVFACQKGQNVEQASQTGRDRGKLRQVDLLTPQGKLVADAIRVSSKEVQTVGAPDQPGAWTA